jgi:predicted enzyme related to lactoylglutathione lyase
MLRGMSTVSYWADDVEAAKAWYAELLGIAPYYEVPGPEGRPAYVEFRLGDYQHELGLIDRRFNPAGPAAAPGGAVVYWAVDDVPAALERLLALGATLHEPPQDRGQAFITATVIDPFGNILGIMQNPHYLEVLQQTAKA